MTPILFPERVPINLVRFHFQIALSCTHATLKAHFLVACS